MKIIPEHIKDAIVLEDQLLRFFALTSCVSDEACDAFFERLKDSGLSPSMRDMVYAMALMVRSENED